MVFFRINQLLNKMSTIDSAVNENFELLTKFLALVEHIIIDSAYHKISTEHENISNDSSIWMLDKIYSTFSVHKENFSKIEKFMRSKEKNVEDISSIINDPSQCKVHKLLENFDEHSDLLKASGIDLGELNNLHIKWHKLISNLKDAVKDEDTTKTKRDF